MTSNELCRIGLLGVSVAALVLLARGALLVGGVLWAVTGVVWFLLPADEASDDDRPY